MTIMSLQQFVQQQMKAPQDRSLLVTVDELVEGLELLEGDRIVEVRMDYQSYASISVNFFPDDTEQ